MNLTVNAVNDAPIAQRDVASASNASQIAIPVLENDRDPEGGTLSIADVFSAAGSGRSTLGAALSISGSGVVYDPRTSATLQSLGGGGGAMDSFSYTVSDQAPA